jgi:hypothetical protein
MENYIIGAFWLYAAFLVVAICSWIANIVKLVGLIGADITTEFVLRIVGVPFAPLGVVMGWL